MNRVRSKFSEIDIKKGGSLIFNESSPKAFKMSHIGSGN